jgi:hypothetical protein
MRLEVEGSLPFVAVRVGYRGAEVVIRKMLVDTGSAGTLLSVDAVASIGLFPLAEDSLHTIRGIGGSEVVFSRRVDYFAGGIGLSMGLRLRSGAWTTASRSTASWAWTFSPEPERFLTSAT